MIRLILVADTHLGFDYPIRPRATRRRRGEDFFRNFQRVLDHAVQVEAAAVIHGGDLFFRSKIPRPIVDRVYHMLFEFAKREVDLVIVPGNHERSRLPTSLLFSLPRVHLFDRPQTFHFELAGTTLSLSGFPFERENVRDRFPEILEQTGWRSNRAEIRLLCLHQAVEGSRVGPSGFTFRHGQDVVQRRNLPVELDAVLCGHIHRRQILGGEPAGDAGAAAASIAQQPLVIYPGSTERTSFAEKDEEKGFYQIDLIAGGPEGSWRVEPRFIPLPARPMVDLVLDLEPGGAVTRESLRAFLQARLERIPGDAIVRLKPGAELDGNVKFLMNAAFLKEVFPETMNVQLSSALFPGGRRRRGTDGTQKGGER